MKGPRYEYILRREPSASDWRCILEHSLGKAAELSVVVTPQLGRFDVPHQLGAVGRSLLDELQPFVTRNEKVDRWPGTMRADRDATLFVYQYNNDVMNVVIETEPVLYAWLQPILPEDPCLYRDDGTVWLGVTSHENGSFLVMTEIERQQLIVACPRIEIQRGRAIDRQEPH